MRRTIGALLALAAQLFPLAGPGALMLCVHEDGQARYELAFALCCDEASSDLGHAGVQQPEGSNQPSVGVDPECDHCQDYAVTLSQVPLPSREIRNLPNDVQSLLPLAEFAPAFAECARETWTVSSNYLGPPGNYILRHLRTIVLQV